MINWIKKNPFDTAFLVAIILLAAFLRFYHLPEFMSFLGDEGRDALVVKKIVTGEHIPLLGPVTSIGNMYLGPLFYYLQIFPMWASNLNPVSMAASVALTGVATVLLLYIVGRDFFEEKAGLFAAALYAVSPAAVEFVRSSWNPRPMPFFALLVIYSLFKINKKVKLIWFLVLGTSLALTLQLHYMAALLIPVVIISLWIIGKKTNFNKRFLLSPVFCLLLFIFLMSPLFFFDIRHNFMNSKALLKFITESNNTSFNPIASLLNFWPNILRIFQELILVNTFLPAILVAVVVVAISLLALFKNHNRFGMGLLMLWGVIGFLGISFYKGPLYLHYFGFLFPLPFLLVGFVLSLGWKKLPLRILSIIIFIIIFGLNLKEVNVFNAGQNQLGRTQSIARSIIEESNNRPFNFSLIAERNYDSAYQYFLELWGHKPAQTDFLITDQLLVVCEDPACQPINNPKWEIASFGWAKIDKEWQVQGVKLFKLVHNNPPK